MPDRVEVAELERRMRRLGWTVRWDGEPGGYLMTAHSYEPDSGERVTAEGADRPEMLRELLGTLAHP